MSDHPILGGLATAVAIFVMVYVVKFLVELEVCAECAAECAAENGNIIYAKYTELLHIYLDTGSIKRTLICVAILVGIASVGLLAGVMDDFLCILPLGNILRDDFDLELPACLRLIPGGIIAVYLTIDIIWVQFDEDQVFDIEKFSIIGKGYTAGMWATQIALALCLISFILLAIEAFIDSGVIGFFIRVPLLVITNASFAAAGSLVFIFILLLAIIFGALGSFSGGDLRFDGVNWWKKVS